MIDLSKQGKNSNSINKEINLHIAFLSLHEFYKIYKKLLQNNKEEINLMMNIIKKC